MPGGTDTVCAIAVDGLSPGVQYGYTPDADGAPLAPESVFQTPDPSRPFTFVAVGDSGSGDGNQLRVRDLMASLAPDMLVHTGDMVYEDGAAVDFNPKFFAPYRDLIRTRMFWPCLGNHDFHTDYGQPWRDAFYTFADNPAGSENYYSFDYGNAHFVVLDSNQPTEPDSPEYDFLDQDLLASDALWKFVVFHHTIYSSGEHGSNLLIQGNLVPLFDRYSVDLVLMGHDHDYERTFPMRGDQIVGPDEGTIYITTGGGGAKLRALGTSSFTAYGEESYHVTRVTVNGKSLRADMVRVDGTIPDSVVLAKDAPSPKCRTDADCEDSKACTIDTCEPDGCHHAVVGFDAVLAGIVAGQAADACAGQSLPHFVSGPLGRAARTVARASTATNPNRAGREMTPAARQLTVVARRADLAAKRGLLAAACATQLTSALTMAEGRAECLANTRHPVADTYIEKIRKGRKNHGAAPELKVDSSPRCVAYLKFDLSAVPSVRHAVLELHVIGKSPDGGKVYSIPSSAWIEGNGNDVDKLSGKGAGLNWDEVDTNGDDVLDASDLSPLVPEPDEVVAKMGAVTDGETVRLNLIRVFQGRAGVHTIAIMNNNPNGAAFASKENPMPSLRPVLRIIR